MKPKIVNESVFFSGNISKEDTKPTKINTANKYEKYNDFTAEEKNNSKDLFPEQTDEKSMQNLKNSKNLENSHLDFSHQNLLDPNTITNGPEIILSVSENLNKIMISNFYLSKQKLEKLQQIQDVFKEVSKYSIAREEFEKYNKDKCPAEMEKIELHMKACRTGIRKTKNNFKIEEWEKQICPCCGMKVVEDDETLSLFCNVKDQYKAMDIGWVLYFMYVKDIIIIVFIITIFQSAYLVIYNQSGSECNQSQIVNGEKIYTNQCESWFNNFHAANRDIKEVNIAEKIQSIVLMVVLYAYVFTRIQQRKNYKKKFEEIDDDLKQKNQKQRSKIAEKIDVVKSNQNALENEGKNHQNQTSIKTENMKFVKSKYLEQSYEEKDQENQMEMKTEKNIIDPNKLLGAFGLDDNTNSFIKTVLDFYNEIEEKQKNEENKSSKGSNVYAVMLSNLPCDATDRDIANFLQTKAKRVIPAVIISGYFKLKKIGENKTPKNTWNVTLIINNTCFNKLSQNLAKLKVEDTFKLTKFDEEHGFKYQNLTLTDFVGLKINNITTPEFTNMTFSDFEEEFQGDKATGKLFQKREFSLNHPNTKQSTEKLLFVFTIETPKEIVKIANINRCLDMQEINKGEKQKVEIEKSIGKLMVSKSKLKNEIKKNIVKNKKSLGEYATQLKEDNDYMLEIADALKYTNSQYENQKQTIKNEPEEPDNNEQPENSLKRRNALHDQDYQILAHKISWKILNDEIISLKKKRAGIYSAILKTLEDAISKKDKYLDSAFVVFEHEIDAILIKKALQHKSLFIYEVKRCCGCLKKGQKNEMEMKVKDSKNPNNEKPILKQIRFRTALHPDDVLWHNFAVPYFKQRMQHMILTVINSIPVIASFFAVSALLSIQEYYKEKTDPNTEIKQPFFCIERLLSISISLSNTIINVLSSLWINFTCNMESWHSKTKLDIMIAKRQTRASVIINTVVIVVATYAYHENYFGFEKKTDNLKEGLWRPGGLGSNVICIMAMNSIMHFLSIFMNISFYKNRLQRWYVKNHLDKYTQSEANAIFEGPQPDIAKWHVDINISLGMSLYFQPLTPIGVYFTLLAGILQYATDKFLLLKIYSEPKVVGEALSIYMLAKLDFMILMFALGQVTFDFILRDRVTIYSWVIFGITTTIYTFNLTRLFIYKMYLDAELTDYKSLKTRLIEKDFPNEIKNNFKNNSDKKNSQHINTNHCQYLDIIERDIKSKQTYTYKKNNELLYYTYERSNPATELLFLLNDLTNTKLENVPGSNEKILLPQYSSFIDSNYQSHKQSIIDAKNQKEKDDKCMRFLTDQANYNKKIDEPKRKYAGAMTNLGIDFEKFKNAYSESVLEPSLIFEDEHKNINSSKDTLHVFRRISKVENSEKLKSILQSYIENYQPIITEKPRIVEEMDSDSRFAEFELPEININFDD